MEKLQQFVVHLLTFANDKEVHKIRHGFCVDTGGAARKYQGQQLCAVGAVQGQTRLIHHVQHRCVGHLIADGKGQRVEPVEAVPALESVEGQTRLLHLVVHVSPGGKHPLTPDIRKAVHGVVEDAHAEVRHADFVSVGETEGHTQFDLLLVLDDLIILAARVARRLLNFGQNAFQSFIHNLLLYRD